MTFKKVIIKDNKDVREKLSRSTSPESGFASMKEQIAAIGNVLKEYSIIIACFDDGWNKDFNCFNCHAYALGIHESKTLLTRLGNHSGEVAFIDGNKMQSLIKEGYLTELEKPMAGSLVLYFDDKQSDKLTHTGIIKELREDGNHTVESKWGDIRAIFTHSISDVPASYGNYVAYFKKPSLEEVENMLDQILETENS